MLIELNKIEKHKEICDVLNRLYVRKNSDYGDSFGETYRKLGIISAITRITDKVNRLQNLSVNKNTQLVEDETIIDSLMDAANYCIMTVIELEVKE